MIFKTRKVNLQTLGEYLLSSREHLGFSPDEVAKISQIQPKFLLALEQGQYQELPATVYVKGFLKTLAKVYGLGETQLLQQYAAEQEIAIHLQSAEKAKQEPKFFLPRFIFSPKTLTILGAVFLALLSLSYLYFQVSSLRRAPVLQVLSPDKDGVVDSSLLVVSGKAEPGTRVYLNDQPLVVDESGEFRENLSLGPGQNQLVVRAVNQFGQQTQVTRSIMLQEKQVAGAFTANTEVSTGPTVEVSIGAEATWIYLETDGVQDYSGTMLPGSTRTVTATGKIVLTTRNAGQTRVILNGKDLGILGKEGEVIRDIEFTK
jgi:cytoskeletal protein RodZ